MSCAHVLSAIQAHVETRTIARGQAHERAEARSRVYCRACHAVLKETRWLKVTTLDQRQLRTEAISRYYWPRPSKDRGASPVGG